MIVHLPLTLPASDNAIAIACLRDFTTLPPLPECKPLSLYSPITMPIFSAILSMFLMISLPRFQSLYVPIRCTDVSYDRLDLALHTIHVELDHRTGRTYLVGWLP